MRLKFYKEPSNRWYVDLPNWEGKKEDLEMVSGADTMLEYMSNGNAEVYLYLELKYFEGSDKLEYIRDATEYNNGAFYIMKTFNGMEYNLDIWLCDVTLFVFGKFPKNIFIKVDNLNNN